MDFRGATNHFADPAFDGEPVQIYEPGDQDPITPPEIEVSGRDLEEDKPPLYDKEATEIPVDSPLPDISLPSDDPEPNKKVYVDGVCVTVLAERVEYLDENGKLVTESLRDYTRKGLQRHFASLDDFLKRWKAAERKQAIIEELEKEGLLLDPLMEEVGKDLDPFDLICHVAFDRPPLTRRERAAKVRQQEVFAHYGPPARTVLEALLDKYQDQGVLNLDDPGILKVAPFDRMGTVVELIKPFGNRSGFEQAVHQLQAALYQEAA
jgi:type I restriction enzyme R subunit